MNDKKRSGGCVMSMVKIVIAGVLLVGIIGAIVSTTKSGPPTPEQVAARSESEELKSAYYAGKGYIQKHLKAPSTAKWSSYYDEDSRTGRRNDITNGFYTVGYVDAENSFGAKLRQTWRVDLIHDGDMWRFFYAKLGDQVILNMNPPTQ